MNLLIITPIFPPTTGGAASYYKELINLLSPNDFFNSITVFTEKTNQFDKGENINSNVDVQRIFVNRSSRSYKGLFHIFLYFFQNLYYPSIFFKILAGQYDSIIVHSSYHNNLNLLCLFLKILPKKITLISDVRDKFLNKRGLYELRLYDKVVSCSKEITLILKNNNIKNIYEIPLIQSRIAVTNNYYKLFKKKYNINKDKFFLSAGLVKKGKNTELLIESFLKKYSKLGYKLVLAGTIKDKSIYMKYIKEESIIFLGSIRHTQLMELLFNCKLLINISSSEGFPRICLESIFLRKNFIMPPSISELKKYFPKNELKDFTETGLLKKINEQAGKPLNNKYPISKHYPKNVLKLYLELFKSEK